MYADQSNSTVLPMSQDEYNNSFSITLPDLSGVDVASLPLGLEQKPPGLTFVGELTNRVGIAYLSGLLASGIYGAAKGWRLAQAGIPMRLKLNSVFNHASKLGAKNANMFAVLACYFVSYKRFYARMFPEINPSSNLIISGASAGALCKFFNPWGTILRFSAAGAAIPATYCVVTYLIEEGYL